MKGELTGLLLEADAKEFSTFHSNFEHSTIKQSMKMGG